jgi:hypothetical protein
MKASLVSELGHANPTQHFLDFTSNLPDLISVLDAGGPNSVEQIQTPLPIKDKITHEHLTISISGR